MVAVSIKFCVLLYKLFTLKTFFSIFFIIYFYSTDLNEIYYHSTDLEEIYYYSTDLEEIDYYSTDLEERLQSFYNILNIDDDWWINNNADIERIH